MYTAGVTANDGVDGAGSETAGATGCSGGVGDGCGATGTAVRLTGTFGLSAGTANARRRFPGNREPCSEPGFEGRRRGPKYRQGRSGRRLLRLRGGRLCGVGRQRRTKHIVGWTFAGLIPDIGAGGGDHEKRQGNLFHRNCISTLNFAAANPSWSASDAISHDKADNWLSAEFDLRRPVKARWTTAN